MLYFVNCYKYCIFYDFIVNNSLCKYDWRFRILCKIIISDLFINLLMRSIRHIIMFIKWSCNYFHILHTLFIYYQYTKYINFVMKRCYWNVFIRCLMTGFGRWNICQEQNTESMFVVMLMYKIGVRLLVMVLLCV